MRSSFAFSTLTSLTTSTFSLCIIELSLDRVSSLASAFPSLYLIKSQYVRQFCAAIYVRGESRHIVGGPSSRHPSMLSYTLYGAGSRAHWATASHSGESGESGESGKTPQDCNFLANHSLRSLLRPRRGGAEKAPP